jgi:hypothetical protein
VESVCCIKLKRRRKEEITNKIRRKTTRHKYQKERRKYERNVAGK